MIAYKAVGYISLSSRLSTRFFCCQRCDFQHNANFVAAANLVNRAVQAGLGVLGRNQLTQLTHNVE